MIHGRIICKIQTRWKKIQKREENKKRKTGKDITWKDDKEFEVALGEACCGECATYVVAQESENKFHPLPSLEG